MPRCCHAARFPHSVGRLRLLGCVVAAMLFSLFLGVQVAQAEPWRFGILADTQWRVEDDGQSPNTVPAGILKQVHQEFIRHGVKFVVAVGDTINRSSKENQDARALYAQTLYNAGIGFYPLRGNHDASWAGPEGSDSEFPRIYPQTRSGVNNATPEFAPELGIGRDIRPDPKTKAETFVVGTNFSSPELTCLGLSKAGLTYSFDYEDARLILLDQFDAAGHGSTLREQQPWINARLADPQRPPHAFVFGHKQVVGTHHRDSLQGSAVTKDVKSDHGDGDGVDPATLAPKDQVALAERRAAEDCFLVALAAYGADYYICGHEHVHFYSLVTAPSGTARVRQLIAQTVSSNFPHPKEPLSKKLTPISEDLEKIGYYVCTVDGPRVTLDYYGAPVKPDGATIHQTPELTGHWRKCDSMGCSLNGREFVVPQGTSYSVVADDTAKAIASGETGYVGTQAAILAGENQSTAAAGDGTPLVKVVDTGWAPAEGTSSDILTLWGLSDVDAAHSDTYVLSLNFPSGDLGPETLASGEIVLASRDAEGPWVNAVATNVTDTTDTEPSEPKFVLGPYQASYGLGVYGLDPATHTAWAVVNHAGQFAVARLAAAK